MSASMETQIHPTAIVADGAQLGEDVQVGPFTVIGENVQIGDRAIIHPNVVIDGHTQLGSEVEVFPGAAIGLKPQDRKYDGAPTRLIVGDRTVLRECTTLQPGTTKPGIEVTTVGEDCLIMAYCHVAHDCVLGNNVILANATQLAGHVCIEDHVILGGVTTVHQFVRIGTRAMTGAATRVLQDIPPYVTADGHPAKLVGLNTIGLKRGQITEEVIRELKKAYKSVFLRGPFRDAINAVKAELPSLPDEVRHFIEFMEISERGITRGRK